ncbi:MAG: ATP-binding protein [Porticoccaceae bacterium]
MKKLPPQSASHENLRTLCLIRLIPLMGMFYGAYYLLSRDASHLHWNFIFALLAAFIVMVGTTWLRSLRSSPISQREFFAHVAADIGIYTLLMFNTGGAANPFVSYLLVPVTIAAITLPAVLTWITGFLCLGAYSTLLFWYIPLPIIAPEHSQHSAGLNPHLVGMWMNFVVSAALIAYFVNKMARTINAQEKTLNLQKERQLEDEQLLAVATLAASAAHELGTPLNTMKLVVADFEDRSGNMATDIQILRNQIDRCQATLKKLSGTARSYSIKDHGEISANIYFNELLESWLVMRPDVDANISITGAAGVATIFHHGLTASLHNLLNNAADASSRVDIAIHWDSSEASILIRDYGAGINAGLPGNNPQKSEKPSGMGLGLFLTRSILARHGGTITLNAHSDGGTEANVVIPLRENHD